MRDFAIFIHALPDLDVVAERDYLYMKVDADCRPEKERQITCQKNQVFFIAAPKNIIPVVLTVEVMHESPYDC